MKIKTAEGKSALLVYKADNIKTVDETLAQCQVMEETFRQECRDSDELLKMLRLDPAIYRTECGYLNLPKIRVALRAELAAVKNSARNIYEIWSGSEGIPIPETALEAYLLRMIEQMCDEAKKGMI